MPPSGGEAGRPSETQSGKSGRSISNEGHGNLDACVSEDGNAEASTVKVFTWPRKATWKVICVTFLCPVGNHSF